MVFLAVLPLLWLIVALSILKVPAWKACGVAAIISFIVAVVPFGKEAGIMATGALEGVALAIWPILLVITSAIFTYNLVVRTGAMETIKTMLTSVSSDMRILSLLLAWGFGAFMEGMAGFGTAVAIPAAMMVGLGFHPLKSILACLVANSVPTTFGSIAIPTTTLATLTHLDSVGLGQFIAIQLFILNTLSPFFVVMIMGGGPKALKGVFLPTLISGLALSVPELLINMAMGPELSVIVPSAIIMGSIVVCAKIFKTDDPEYRVEAEVRQISSSEGISATMPFILIFVLLIITSKFFPFINGPLSAFKTSVQIYAGPGASPYTFVWLATPGVLIFLAAFISGYIQKASFSEMFFVLLQTIRGLRNTIITIIAVIATAKVMGYSGMTSDIASTAVDVTGNFYPFIAPIIGSIGTFITGSGTSSNVLFGNLQTDAAKAIGANAAWLAAANSAGTCVGKMISPQSIAIAVGAISLVGKDSEILKSIIKVYVPYAIILGCIVYFGQLFIS